MVVAPSEGKVLERDGLVGGEVLQGHPLPVRYVPAPAVNVDIVPCPLGPQLGLQLGGHLVELWLTQVVHVDRRRVEVVDLNKSIKK